MDIKIGICTYTIKALQQPESCKLIKELGFDGLQLDLWEDWHKFDDPKIQQAWINEAKKYDLKLCSLILNTFLDLSLNSPKNLALANELTVNGLRVASQMGLAEVIYPSFRNSLVQTKEDLTATKACLNFACEQAKQYGLTVGWENSLTPDAAKAVQAENWSNFKIYLDTFNYPFVSNQEFIPVLTELLPVSVQEIHIKEGDTTCSGAMLLGTGTGQISAIVGKLKELNFTGWLMIENFYERSTFKSNGLSSLELAQQDLSYLRKLLA